MAHIPKWTSTRFRREVFAKTGGRCFFCGVHIKCDETDRLPRDWLLVRGNPSRLMTPDHAHPKVRGGGDGLDNRLPACRTCNGGKGALDVAEFRFVKAFRARDLNFTFAGEEAPEVRRDWLCVYSDDQERVLFAANFPWASGFYSRGGGLPGRRPPGRAAR